MDITVTKIINLYYLESNDWKRDFFKPRIYEAIAFFKEGEIEYRFQNQTVSVKKGDIFFLPSGLPYSGIRRSDHVAYYVLNFTCLQKNELLSLGAPITIHSSNYDATLSEFQNAIDDWNKQKLNINFRMKSLLFSILSEANVFSEQIFENEQGNKIVTYISENFCNPQLSVSMLCQLFFLSESQLRRYLHKITNLSPNKYIVALRINKAKTELTNTTKSIKQISIECGFSSQYYFSRCFTKIIGMSPTEYRTLTYI